MQLTSLLFVLSLFATCIAAKQLHNETSLHYGDEGNCALIDAAMAPVCGDRAYQWQYKCEKQCVDAVVKLLRQTNDKNMCVVEWKVIQHLQKTQCPQETTMFGLAPMSVTTIASAFLSAFLLFSCTS
ncbi:hypothetical protein THRCLA_08914 [Thraustotheca clavata]|uniref:Secreted protein n=1 Tax=Thraustotheca clavata TaxID=74557 RepID=A0A1V9Z157_9STRA|nr:hypothetical protein THRCLA_08914 [Thraustotheca clavata]